MFISCTDLRDVIEPIISLGRGAVWQWALAALLSICWCSRLFSAAQIGPFPATTIDQHTPYTPSMSYPPTSTSPGISLQSNERIGQAIRDESQQQRYAPFSCSGCLFVVKHGQRPTVHWHALLQSTCSTMIPFLTSSTSIDQPSLTETRVILTESAVGGDGTVNDGGTNSHKFAKDGETSYSSPRPTWIFASSVHMAHQLQTCWHIRLPFHLSWIIFAPIGISLQKMTRE